MNPGDDCLPPRIRFLANRAPFAEELDRLLADGAVAGHEFVYGEVPPVPHSDVVAFVRARKIHGRGIGWIDAHLLASALVGGVQLWTADGPLGAIAEKLEIAYHVEDSGSA